MKNIIYFHHSLQKISLTNLLISAIIISLFVLVFLLIKQQFSDLSTLTATRVKSEYVDCNLQQLSCSIATDQGQIILNIQRPIESLIPFVVSLDTSAIELDDLSFNNPTRKKSASTLTSVKLRFEGLEDYMGITQLEFNRTENTSENKLWSSRSSIPVCTTESNMWRVTINLQYENHISSYWFKLKSL